MTRRRWIAEHWDEATATIAGAQAEHLARVLRAQPGMEADVVAGGRVFHAAVAAPPSPAKKRGPLQPGRRAPGRSRAARHAGPRHLQVRSHGVGNRESHRAGRCRGGACRRAANRKAFGPGCGEARRALAPHRARGRSTGAPLRRALDPRSRFIGCARACGLSRPRASCLQSRSAPPLCVTRSTKPSRQPTRKCPRLKSQSALKADGRPRKKRSSTPMAGAPLHWARASCALKPPPSPRWPSSLPALSDSPDRSASNRN